MNYRIVKTIYVKELMDTLRDKRTLLAMVGVPIVLYPLLFIVVAQTALLQQAKVEESTSRVLVIAEEESLVRSWVEPIEMVELVDSEDPKQALLNGDIDAILRVDGNVQEVLDAQETVTLEIEFDTTESLSRRAAGRLYDGLDKQSSELLKLRIEERALPEGFAAPFEVEETNIESASKRTGFFLGMILPMMLVMMLGIGAFYPAVDLTAGEKERGTFETLLSTPTSKLEIVTGKFLTVFTLAIVTGFLNLASMAATALFQLSQLLNQADESTALITEDMLRLPPMSILFIGVMIIPLALFICASMMAVAVLAKSFKEAQNYVTPFFLAIIIPATVAALPDVKLGPITQFIPIANVSLLFRDLMMDKSNLESAFAVLLCTSVYAVLALIVAAWMFQREEVILSEERGMPISLNRDDFTAQDVPTPGQGLGLFAIVMLLIFYVGSVVQMKNIHVGLVITEYVLILAPVVLWLWFSRTRLQSALNLNRPSLGAIAGTLLITAGWLVLLIQIGIWSARVLPPPEEFAIFAEQLMALAETRSGLVALLLIVAVSPAICEEALFRGAILSSLRGRMSNVALVLCVGILFGLFHLSVYRFVPTAASGLVLTYVALRSRSILPAMLLHMLMNGSAILLESGNVPTSIVDYLENRPIEQTGLPIWLIAAGATVFFAGVVVMEVVTRSRNT